MNSENSQNNDLKHGQRHRRIIVSPPLMIASWVLMLLTTQQVRSATLHVDASSTGASIPYSSWPTAATSIQDAVDAANSDDTILVNDGIYSNGSTISPDGELACRVVITKNVTIQSVNGPESTVIQGEPDPVAIDGLGSNAIRCVYISSGSLEGFTITAGHTDLGTTYINVAGGGVYLNYGGVLNNCIISENSGDYCGGGVFFNYGGAINDSTISSNTAKRFGGGAYFSHGGSMSNCAISRNTAESNYGGGVMLNYGNGYLNRCTISENSANIGGGGAYFVNGGGRIDNSTLVDNTAGTGGGVFFRNMGGILYNCVVAKNTANSAGGVAFYYGGVLQNCTVTRNSAPSNGDGVYVNRTGYLRNSIIWNDSVNEDIHIYDDGTGQISFENTCAGDGLTSGVNGCLIANPQFIDAVNENYRLTSSSPCIDAGNNSYTLPNTDLSLQPRKLDGDANGTVIVDIGAYEFLSDNVDTDTDGVSDWKEYIADTDVADANSFFRIQNIVHTSGKMSVSFDASINRIYTVQFRENLSAGGWGDLAGLIQLSDLEGLCELVDTNSARNTGFYKVKVELP